MKTIALTKSSNANYVVVCVKTKPNIGTKVVKFDISNTGNKNSLTTFVFEMIASNLLNTEELRQRFMEDLQPCRDKSLLQALP